MKKFEIDLWRGTSGVMRLFTFLALCSASAAIGVILLMRAPIWSTLVRSLLQGAFWSAIICEGVLMLRCRPRFMTVSKSVFATLFGVYALAETACIAATGGVTGTGEVLLLLETNSGEATGFISQYFTAKTCVKTVGVLAFIIFMSIAIPWLLKKGMESCKWIKPAVKIILFYAVLNGGLLAVRNLSIAKFTDYPQLQEWVGQSGDSNPMMTNNIQIRYAGLVGKTVFTLKEISLLLKHDKAWEQVQRDFIKNHQPHYGLQSAGENMQSEAGDAAKGTFQPGFNIVVIIGESFIRSHSSLYGYRLKTNPRLEAERDSGRLAVFTRISSPANFTTQSLRNTLNLNSIEHSEKWHETVFWPLAMAKAGWNVALFDNQTVSARNDIGLSRMLYNPAVAEHTYGDRRNDSTFTTDGPFLEHVRRLKKIPAGTTGNLAIYHLMGQHFPAKRHYEGSGRFTAADIPPAKPWMDETARKEVADYDNCTLYNDSIVWEIFNDFSSTPTVEVYFSDHGEDIWDLAPAGSRNKPQPDDPEWIDRQFHIPFVIRVSEPFKEQFPEITGRIFAATDRPGMTDNLGQLLLGLTAGAPGDTLYRPERDLLSPAYNLHPTHSHEGYFLPFLQ